jgi:hypothetical protein
MPSITLLHSHPFLQNVLLIALSFSFFPLLTFLAFLAAIISPWLASTKHIYHTRRWRSLSSSTFRPRTVLVTNVRTPQSLAIARIFYRAGHRVIGANYEEYYFPIPAHFSKSVEVFYRVGGGKGERGKERDLRDLVDIVRKEVVDLWVNCDDIVMKEVLERKTGCRVLQFGREVMELLGDEVALREHVQKLGLDVAEHHSIMSQKEALDILDPEKSSGRGKQYTIQSASSADTGSSEMALLPLSSRKDIKAYIKNLSPSPSNPLELQEYFPEHQQYTAYALIINSKPAAFIAYPSSSALLTPLPSSTPLFQSLLQYTAHLASSLPPKSSQSGHLTLSFSLPSESHSPPSTSMTTSSLPNIHLLSITPTLSLGTLAFKDLAEDLTSAYLSLLPDHEPRGVGNGHWEEKVVVPSSEGRGYYFLQNEVWNLVLVPTLGVLRWQIGVWELMRGWIAFLGLVVGGREVWWKVWDPWVWWWRYGGYVVGRGLLGLWDGENWIFVNEI